MFEPKVRICSLKFLSIAEGLSSSEARGTKRLRKLTVGGSVRIGDQEFVVLSFSSRNFLYNQVLSLTFFLLPYFSCAWS